ncbi:MAG: META domain-containing protein [Chitinispirillales bacterium]|jgi:hypothetical protein|nr:META domain-containing protein [Chitinispirillales bacterium]
MKKKIFLLSIIAVLAFAVMGCDTLVKSGNGGEDIPPSSPYTLTDTSWKLVAIADITSGTSREPNCGEYMCEVESYTLTFTNDSTAYGKSTVNQMFGRYIADYRTGTLFWHEAIWTMQGGEMGDGEMYIHALTGDKSRPFKLYSQELHVFYNNGKEYMKFNRIEGGRV